MYIFTWLRVPNHLVRAFTKTNEGRLQRAPFLPPPGPDFGLYLARLGLVFACRGGRCPRCPRRPRRDRARRCFHCLSSRTARCRPRPRTASFPRGRLQCQQSRRTRGQQHCQQGNRWRGSPWRPASRLRLRSMRQRSPPKGKDPTSSSTRHCPREKQRAGDRGESAVAPGNEGRNAVGGGGHQRRPTRG